MLQSVEVRRPQHPSSWGAVGAFPVLSTLQLQNMPLTGSMPPLWGITALPNLTDLELIDLNVSGPLV